MSYMKSGSFAIIHLFVIKESITLGCGLQVYDSLTFNVLKTNSEATII